MQKVHMIPPKPTTSNIQAIRRLIPDLDYLNQVIHQTAAMGLKHIFFIEFNPQKKEIIRVVHMDFSEHDAQQKNFLDYYKEALGLILDESELLEFVKNPNAFPIEGSAFAE